MNPRAILACLLLAPPAASHAADARQPNILYIMADDHGRQAISAYGGKLIQTPQLDRLAGEGVRFDQAFANNSICSPSRAVLLTGKYNHICGVRKLGERFDGSQQTFPKLLQQAGYRTALIGKWHLASQPTGFDHYCVVPLGAHVNPPMTDETMPWKGEGGGKRTPGYSTDLLTDLSMDWMTAQKDRPFCLMLHFTAPHSPHVPAPRHQDLFKDTVFPEPPNLLDDYAGRAPEKVADQIAWSRLLINDYPQYQSIRKEYSGDRTRDTRRIYQEYARGYLRMVAGIDENIGRVLDYLEKSGLAANTIVIYTSDNGFFLGEHGLYNKMWMYEESAHIPLMIHLPGMRTAAANNRIVSMLDMAPTILDLAGVKIPADIQGVSMKPLLLGEPVTRRDALYYHFYGYGAEQEWFCPHEIFGVRTGTDKLIHYPTWQGGPFWEYFDLTRDPLEMHNLYSTPAAQAKITNLKKLLREMTGQYRDTAATELLDQADQAAPEKAP